MERKDQACKGWSLRMKVKVQLSSDRTSWNWRHVLACRAERLWGRRVGICSGEAVTCGCSPGSLNGSPLPGDGRAWLAAPGTRLHLASARPHSHFTSCSLCLTNINQCKFFLSHGKLQTPADGGTLLGAVPCHHLVTAWSLALTRASQHRHRRLFSLPCPAPKQDLYLKYL